MKSRLIVVGLIKKGDKFLIGQKTPGRGPYPDTWHIPGGGINMGEENTEEAVQREIKEETNLEVDNLERVNWDTDIEPDKRREETYYIFLQFICDYKSGDLVAGDDMHHFEWVKKEDLKSYNLNRPSKKLFKYLGYL